VLKKLDGDLEWVKLGFGDVLRTWFFLDDILAWYAEFNQVRTRFLADRGPLDRPPASTAVGYAAGAGEPAAAGATADSDANASGRPRPSSHRDLALAATAI
jgi:enamine deaminase RidA (YjgF/YER057c/UK114 family)